MATISSEKEFWDANREGKKVYKKICKNPKCNKEYISDSRNQKYCSSECSEYMKILLNKKSKRRAIKRKEYSENQEINRALSKTYSLAHDMATLYRIPVICQCKEQGLEGECRGEIQLHHHNCNPFDNSPSNIYYLCGSHHKMFHDKYLNEVNMVSVYKEAVDNAGFEDDDKKHIKMIATFRSKVEGVRKNGENRGV